MSKAITLAVTGAQKMACEGCEKSVERIVRELPGVTSVRARSSDQRIEVGYDPSVLDIARVADSLRAAGYETTVVS